MDLKAILITWMDGESETYSPVTTSIRDGVLHVHEYASATNGLTGEWHFPLSNIRSWQPVTTPGHPQDIIAGSGQRGEPRQLSQMTSVRLSPPLVAALREHAQRHGKSVSDLLREAAIAMLAREEAPDAAL